MMPDTSPRGPDVPNDDAYDLGVGAGFYVDATQEPWLTNYQMYTYVTSELSKLLETKFRLGNNNVKSISGHSMGGHGALTLAFRNPEKWVSVSAISPICNPTNCAWGEKAFKAYFGSVDKGREHDATLLLGSKGTPFAEYDDILIDQGSDDDFLKVSIT